MKLQIKYILTILILLIINAFSQSQSLIWPLQFSNANCTDQINCTFSEIHKSGNGMHEAIDIQFEYNKTVNAVIDGRIYKEGSELHLRWNYQDPLDDNSYLNQVVYGDLMSLKSTLSSGQWVSQGQIIGNMIASSNEHLHFEIMERDNKTSTWRFVDPLKNSYCNYFTSLPNLSDTDTTEINDVILHTVNEPIGINSGIIATSSGGITNFHEGTKKIHIKDRPNSNGVEYKSSDKVVVFGSIGSILHARDPQVTKPISCANAVNSGAGIYEAVFRINGTDKYQVKFDSLRDDETGEFEDYYHISFNTAQGTDRKYGNNDYLEMRRVIGETARCAHKKINNIQSNGVWATRAKEGTADVFATTPTELAMCPDEAKYKDGKHTLNFTVSDAAANSVSKDIEVIVDNFKPYVKKVKVTYNNAVIYEAGWDCQTDCIKFNTLKSLQYNLSGNDKYTVEVTMSEEVAYTSFPIAFNGTTVATTPNSNQGNVYTFTGLTLGKGTLTIGDANVKDLAGNSMLDLSPHKSGTCVSVPTRTGASTWTNPNNLVAGSDDSYELPQPCPKLIVDFSISAKGMPSTCFTNGNGFIVINNVSLPSSVIKSQSNIHLVSENPQGGYNTLYTWPATSTFPLNATNLGQGKYYISVTDQNNCSGISTLFIELKAHSIDAVTELINIPCTGMTNGEIKITASSPTKSTNFNFEWQPINVTEFGGNISIKNSLATGTYTILVTETATGCTVLKSVTLPNGSLTIPKVVLDYNNPCQNKTNGSISLKIEGYNSNYKIVWDGPGIVSNPLSNGSLAKFNLGTGTYSVVVTNQCGISVEKTVTLSEVGGISLSIDNGPNCNPLVKVNTPANANLPLTYKWSTGEKTPTIEQSNNSSTAKVGVEVTDALGCASSSEISTSDFPSFNIGQIRPCEGTGNTGQITINIYNPKNVPMEVKYLGTPLVLTSLFNPNIPNAGNKFVHQAVLSNVNAQPFSFNVTIGGCTTTQTVDLTTIPRERRLTTGDAKTGECFYDEFCNGTLLCKHAPNNKCFTNIGKIEAKRFTLKPWKPCQKSVNCENRIPSDGTTKNVGKVNFKYQKGTIYEYLNLLNGLIVLPNISNELKAEYEAYRSFIEGVKKKNNLSDCTTMRWCPSTMKYGPTGSYATDFEFVSIDPITGCHIIKCKGIEEKICFDKFSDLPNIDEVIKNINNCEPVVNNGYQLLVWQQEMRTLFPKTYPGSQLDSFLTANKDNKSLNCAKITYCTSNFSIKDDDIDLVDCDPIDFAWGQIKMCEPLPTPNADITKVNCRKSSGNYDVIPIYPNFYKAKPAPIVDVITDITSSSFDKFVDFTDFEGNMSICIKKIGNEYKLQQKHSYFKFDLEEQYLFLNVDEESEEAIGIIKALSGFDIVFENANLNWQKNITADYVDIKKYKKGMEYIEIAGYFNGNLDFNNTLLSSNTETSGFTLKINKLNSNIEEFHVIKNIDERSSVFYTNQNGFGIVGTAENQNVIIDNVSLASEFPKYLYNITSINDKQSKKYPFTGKFKIERMSDENFDKEQFLLFSGLVDLTINNTKVNNFDNQHSLINLNNPDKRVIINYANNIKNYTDLIISKGNSVFIGVTFKERLSVLNSSFTSKGDDDIFLLKYDNINNITSYKHYGSIDKEYINNIYPLNNGILLGGDLEGKTFERKIGDTKFIKLSENIKDAFIAFEDNFIPLRVDDGTRQIKKDNILFSAQIQPNPFNDFIYLKLICSGSCNFNIKLINILGAEVYNEYINTTEGENIFKLNKENLSAGTYIVEITDSFGKKQTLKAIKN